MKHGKKYMDSLALIDRQKQYDLADAIELVTVSYTHLPHGLQTAALPPTRWA